MIDLLTAGYTLAQLEGSTGDNIIEGIFNCIAERDPPLPTILQVTSMDILSSDLTHQDTPKTSNQSTVNTENKQETQMTSLQENSKTTNVQAEPEIPTLNTMLENPHFKALLENPNLNTLLENPNVKALLEDPAIKAQLENPTISSLPGSFP
jgi:hypothetical protein